VWQWHNDVVRRELLRHLALIRPARVGAVVTEQAREMYRITLRQMSADVVVIDNPASLPKDIGVVAVIAENSNAAWRAYTSTMAVVRDRLPVVYCLPDRRVPVAPPGWENSGIHNEGMFKLASLYAPTVARGDGSYVEFGVYDGKSFILGYHALSGVCQRFYAFDSFAGIRGTQKDEETHFKDEQYSASLTTLQHNFRFAEVDVSKVTVVPGFYQDTIKGKSPEAFGIRNACVVHIDTDVYEPALIALEFISNALQQGALLLFDDYDQLGASNDKGERRAVREWLANHPEVELEAYRSYATFSRAFIVHRKR
jgi:O-methyltransferase